MARIDYEALVNDSFIEVIRRLLEDMRDGSFEPSPPALYLTFKTGFDGVEMPLYLKDKFPEEMTVVLQHQYEGLQVGKDFFSAKLSFSGKKEFLKVPFSSLAGFYDMEADFRLKLIPRNTAKKSEPDKKIISMQDLKKKK